MRKIFLLGIIILASLLRFYELEALPALNADEAAIGYNAYSLLQTGRDEHGNLWPIHFQSFNDYKPGLYFYIVLPFVALFGLTEAAVRIPGALLGVSTVLVVWLLVRELFPQKKFLPEVSALFLAISPWHLHFSRGGWEVNAATFFIVLGLWSFLRALESRDWVFISVLAFVASLYTYHAARIVTPLLVLGLLIIYREKLFLPRPPFFTDRKFLLGLLMGIVLIVPLLFSMIGPGGVARSAGVSIFADDGPVSRVNRQRGEHKDLASIPALLFHNKPINYGLEFLENYTEHFLGNFLFISGDVIQRNKVPEFGQMYLLDIIFVIIGFIAIARNTKEWMPILIWLVIAPISAALTFQSPHALRAQNMVIPLVMIGAYGAVMLFSWLTAHIKPKVLLTTCCLLLATLLLWDFTRYLHKYYVYMAKTYNFSSQYGVTELVDYVKENERNFDQIIITDRYDQPYILFLFYLQYPPAKFQKEHVLTQRDKFGFSTVRAFGKYKFVSINWDQMRDFRATLLVGAPGEINDIDANIVKRVHFPSGDVAFEIVPL